MTRQRHLGRSLRLSTDFLLREADLALGRDDHYELETLIGMVYEHFDSIADDISQTPPEYTPPATLPDTLPDTPKITHGVQEPPSPDRP